MTRPSVITVDGPGGTGKSTVCGFLAKKLGWHFLNSGSLYRGLAYAALQRNLALDDTDGLVDLAGNLDIRFVSSGTDSALEVILDQRSIGDKLATEECAAAASRIAAIAEVRTVLLDRQRAFLKPPGLVADGRDMGTVVFPDAPLKIYLHADAGERAKRRYKQLKQQGIDANLARLSVDISERDAKDSEREVCPLKPAEDAIIIDTTHIDAEVVIEIVLENVINIFNENSVYSRF